MQSRAIDGNSLELGNFTSHREISNEQPKEPYLPSYGDFLTDTMAPPVSTAITIDVAAPPQTLANSLRNLQDQPVRRTRYDTVKGVSQMVTGVCVLGIIVGLDASHRPQIEDGIRGSGDNGWMWLAIMVTPFAGIFSLVMFGLGARNYKRRNDEHHPARPGVLRNDCFCVLGVVDSLALSHAVMHELQAAGVVSADKTTRVLTLANLPAVLPTMHIGGRFLTPAEQDGVREIVEEQFAFTQQRDAANATRVAAFDEKMLDYTTHLRTRQTALKDIEGALRDNASRAKAQLGPQWERQEHSTHALRQERDVLERQRAQLLESLVKPVF